MKNFKTGVYEHWKGKKYLILGMAKHSETLEDMVVYVSLHDTDRTPQHLWVRPFPEFDRYKVKDGKKVKAFKYIGGY
ncbi:MAG: DUF1653 domain-containing protein [bacterium]